MADEEPKEQKAGNQTVKHALTEVDLQAHATLAENGYKAGDEIEMENQEALDAFLKVSAEFTPEPPAEKPAEEVQESNEAKEAAPGDNAPEPQDGNEAAPAPPAEDPEEADQDLTGLKPLTEHVAGRITYLSCKKDDYKPGRGLEGESFHAGYVNEECQHNGKAVSRGDVFAIMGDELKTFTPAEWDNTYMML